MNKWNVGDFVAWDGSCSPWYKRIYRGTIVKIEGGLAHIVDNEWGATSAVRLAALIPGK